jgi:uncharacterized protein (DUF1499 family)
MATQRARPFKGLIMNILGVLVLGVLLVAIGLVIAGQMGLLTGKVPGGLGVTEGRLKGLSKTSNCVSSQAGLYPDHPQKEYASIAPLKFAGNGDQAMDKLATALSKTERTVLVKRELGYIYAQSTTALLKFTDDLELWLDKPNGVIQVRSSSRLGQKDFGVNRARIEALRAQL